MKNKGAYLILVLEIILISVLHAVKIRQEADEGMFSAGKEKSVSGNYFHARANTRHIPGTPSFLQVFPFNEQRSPLQH